MSHECGLPPLTLSMPVQAILREWPQTASVFLKHRMSCVGCSLEAFDSLGDALGNYAIPVEAFLHDLCEAIRKETT